MAKSSHKTIVPTTASKPAHTPEDRAAFDAHADTRVFDDESDYYSAWRTWLASRDHYTKQPPICPANENKSSLEQIAAGWETLVNIGVYLNIDFEAARSAPGTPSDVFIRAIEKAKENAVQEALKKRSFFARLKAMLG